MFKLAKLQLKNSLFSTCNIDFSINLVTWNMKLVLKCIVNLELTWIALLQDLPNRIGNWY